MLFMKKSLRKLISVVSICAAAQVIAEEAPQKESSMFSLFSGASSPDVCNLNLIYDKGRYEYSLPKAVLESFLSGKAFDNPDVYTDGESARLRADINAIFQKILSANPVKMNLAVITAGAPGAGKTMKMREDLAENASYGRNFAYVDPDDVCLKNQTRTYKADIESGNGSKEARQAAYNKWRPGSNAATHLILGNLIRDGYAFYFGSTSSGPSTNKSFEFLKNQGYQIRLIHVTAPDEVRWESIKERDKTFVQTTEQDVKEKGLLLPQRIMDTFLAYADEIEFYYRDGVKKDAQLAATWVRNKEGGEALGTLKVADPSQYEKIKAIHNEAVKVLGKPELQWESTVEKHSNLALSNR